MGCEPGREGGKRSVEGKKVESRKWDNFAIIEKVQGSWTHQGGSGNKE